MVGGNRPDHNLTGLFAATDWVNLSGFPLPILEFESVMQTTRQQLIDRARELNTLEFGVMELQERIREVCAEYLIEAEVDVDRLLRHADWRVRWSALDIVWWGLGATDGIDQTIKLLMQDPDEDIRAQAALALYEAARGSSKQPLAIDALRTVAEDAGTDNYVREAARSYLTKLSTEG